MPDAMTAMTAMNAENNSAPSLNRVAEFAFVGNVKQSARPKVTEKKSGKK